MLCKLGCFLFAWIFFQQCGLPYIFMSLHRWCWISHYLSYSLVARVWIGINDKWCIGNWFCIEFKKKTVDWTCSIKHSWPWWDPQKVNENELHRYTVLLSSTCLSLSRTAKDGSCVFLSFSKVLFSILSGQDIHLLEWNLCKPKVSTVQCIQYRYVWSHDSAQKLFSFGFKCQILVFFTFLHKLAKPWMGSNQLISMGNDFDFQCWPFLGCLFKN